MSAFGAFRHDSVLLLPLLSAAGLQKSAMPSVTGYCKSTSFSNLPAVQCPGQPLIQFQLDSISFIYSNVATCSAKHQHGSKLTHPVWQQTYKSSQQLHFLPILSIILANSCLSQNTLSSELYIFKISTKLIPSSCIIINKLYLNVIYS